MYKVPITYEDYNGKKRTEDFYFNLTEFQFMKLAMTSGDYTLDQVLERLAKEYNGKKIIEFFENLVYESYGEKSLDGRQFIQNDEVKRNFTETPAYSKFMMDICTDSKKAIAFVKGIMSKELMDGVEKILRENPDGVPDNVKEYFNVDDKPKDLVKKTFETLPGQMTMPII